MYKFDTMAELIAAKNAPFACPANVNHSYITAAQLEFQPHWVCADRRATTHAEISHHLESQSFPEGVARIEKLSAQLTAPTPVNRRRKAVRADAGDELDMGRVWNGDLERAWRATRREQSVGPSRVLIAVDIAASCFVESDELAYRGACALALASTLLDAGFVVSIVAMSKQTMTNRENTPYKSEVTILEAGQTLDLHKLANLTASGLLFRGVILDHTVRVAPSQVCSGISYSKNVELKDLDTNGYDYAALVGEAQGEKRGAEQWLQTHLKALDPNQQ